MTTKRFNIDLHLAIAITEAIVSICLLVLAFVGARYASGQLGAMRQQNEVMLEQNRLMMEQQRPWISLHVTPIGEPKGGEPWFFDFEMENHGQLSGRLHEVKFDVAYFTPGKEISGIGKLELRPTENLYGNFAVQDGTQVINSLPINKGDSRPYGRPYRVNLDPNYGGTRDNLYRCSRQAGPETRSALRVFPQVGGDAQRAARLGKT